MNIGSAEVAFAACRVVLGVLFVAQAYDKIFGLGLSQVTDSFAQPLRRLPRSLVSVGVILNSYIELIAGVLLVVGLLTTPALYLLAFDMVLVSIGFSIIKPMWDMQHFFPRFLLLLILLFLPASYNSISADQLLGIIP